MTSKCKKIKQELSILPAFPIEANGLFRRVSFQFLLHFPRRAALFFLSRDEVVQWPSSPPYRQERCVFVMTVVFALNKKSASGRHFVWFCNICDSPVTLRGVETSRKLPGKLPEKITGSKITGVSRNTRKVYGDLPGDLPGPIIYRAVT